MNNIIEIKNLSKSFGTVKAVRDISFHVKKGELFAFLGVNGAGKSTTISIMSGQLEKDSGSVVIDGKNIDDDPDGAKKALVWSTKPRSSICPSRFVTILKAAPLSTE